MATRTWDNGAATQNWEDAANWSDNTVPVTGDDVVIPAGMGIIVGTPSADVLGTVTVNGDSVLNVTLEAANFVFNDSSRNNKNIVGTCTFNDSSYNASGAGIAGTCTFNDNSRNNYVIIGTCTFNDSSYNDGGGAITGDAFFTNTVQSTATTGRFNPQQGTVTGGVDFPNGCEFTLEDGEQWTVDTTGWTASVGLLTWVFNGTSNNTGILNGDADFLGLDSHNHFGIVNGNAYFGPAVNPNTFTLGEAIGTITAHCELAIDVAVIGGADTDPFSNISGTVTISGNLIVVYNGNSESFIGNTSAFVVTGSLEFVFSGDGSQNNGTIFGDVTFSGADSGNSPSGLIIGNVTCSGEQSYIAGNVTGVCNMVAPTAFCYEAEIIGTVIFRELQTVKTTLLQASNPFNTNAYTPTLVFPFADVLGTGLL